jgi:hypothetical protein
MPSFQSAIASLGTEKSTVFAESNYTITELECLAIVYSVRKLHAYLDGVKFTLITDLSALQWLFDFTSSNRRLVRWSMELQPYRDDMDDDQISRGSRSHQC